MQGSYQMVGDDGEQFDAPIAAFRLAMPACCIDLLTAWPVTPSATSRAVATN
jgi:hypothetical protein